MKLDLPFVIAHRGASGSAPENTLAAVRRARVLGCRWVEVDVQLTADNVPVVIHDHTLARTTDGQGTVASATANELAARDAGSWFGPAFDGEAIPTLAQLLQVCREISLGVNIEIKPAPGAVEKTSMAVAAVIDATRQPVLVSSFSAMALRVFHAAAPKVPLGAVYRSLPRDDDLRALAVPVDTVHVAAARLTRTDVARLAGPMHRVLAFTVNEREQGQRLRDWGVTAIFSDHPERFSGLGT